MLESRIGIAIVLGLLGLGALGWVIYRRRQLLLDVREQFRAFREQAVVLMDRLDALRQRHRTMTSTDPDFEVPMSGATRAFYDRVNQELEGLWDRWLQVMEVWKRAQERLAASSGLTTGPVEEARALLAGGEIEALVRETEACQERLDRLNQAHERAREQLHAVRHELAAVQHDVTRGTGVLLPDDRHHEVLEESERALIDAETRIAADPIGAEELILQTRGRLGSLTTLPEHASPWSVGGLTSQPLFAELSAAAERLRAMAARLQFTSVIGFIVRAWLTLTGLAILLMLLLPLAPLGAFLLFVFLLMASFWFIVRAQVAWFWRMVSSPAAPRVERRWPHRRTPGQGL